MNKKQIWIYAEDYEKLKTFGKQGDTIADCLGKSMRLISEMRDGWIEDMAENSFHQAWGESDWESHPEEDWDGVNGFRELGRKSLLSAAEGTIAMWLLEVQGMNYNTCVKNGWFKI